MRLQGGALDSDKMGASGRRRSEMRVEECRGCEMEKQHQNKERKERIGKGVTERRNVRRRRRGEEREERAEEECVGWAPGLEDDSQLSLSTTVTRKGPRLSRSLCLSLSEREREREGSQHTLDFAMPLP